MATTPKPVADRPRSRRALAFAGVLLAAGAIAVAGMVIGWRLAGPTESETALGRVSFQVEPDFDGGIDAFVPIADWGLRADSFQAPFELQVEVRTVDRAGALAAAGDSGQVLEGLEQDLERDARSAAVRGFGWGLAAVCVIALLIWLAGRRTQRTRRVAYLSVVLAAAGGGGSLAAAAASFDSESFSDPSYYGRGEELAQLLDFFERQRDNERYTSTFEHALGNFSAYLSDAPRAGEAGGATLSSVRTSTTTRRSSRP